MLFVSSVFERYENNLEFTVFKSSIDLNEASINQVELVVIASVNWNPNFSQINALAERTFRYAGALVDWHCTLVFVSILSDTIPQVRVSK